MDNRLYILSNGNATEMTKQQYDTEDYLQQIVKNNPHLLTRAWEPDESRLYLIGREFQIAEADRAAAFSLDHLFVANDAVPVLVEVKRSTDTRIRREVVGQMMDYACRAIGWDAAVLREGFRNNNPEDSRAEVDTDEFWERVATNLKTERLRLVFVADKIPDTLRVLIEFLDRSMSNIEVYGVELTPYATHGTIMLSSNIIGNSPLTESKTAKRMFKSWDDASFEEYLRQRGEAALIDIIFGIRDSAKDIGASCVYGNGGAVPSIVIKIKDRRFFKISGWWKKSMGYVYTAEFNIKWFLSYLGDVWTDSRLRELISQLPNKQEFSERGLIWNSPDCLYIDFRAITTPDSLRAFKKNLAALGEVISKALESNLSIVTNKNSTPPPENSAF